MGRMANSGKVWTFIMMVMKAMYSRTLMKPAGQSQKWALLPLYFTLRTTQSKTAQMNNLIDIWDHGKCNCSLVGTTISPVMVVGSIPGLILLQTSQFSQNLAAASWPNLSLHKLFILWPVPLFWCNRWNLSLNALPVLFIFGRVGVRASVLPTIAVI